MISELSKQVSKEINSINSQKQFGISNIQLHIHNGIDTNPSFEPTRSYSGFVPANGDISGESTDGFIYFPDGWKIRKSGTNVYVIQHLFGTKNYSVVPIMLGINASFAFPSVIYDENLFTVTFFDNAGLRIEMDFFFHLVNVTNKNVNFPSYVGQK